jgi:type II secretory pathway pseudopilin PulG
MVRARLRCERGFGLIELLMAMTMLNVGILALVAAFNSGAFALNRAGKISTASALADQQMEIYRLNAYTAIFLDTTSESTARTTDTTYNCDVALNGCSGGVTQVTATCAALSGETGSPPPRCNARRTITGPDRRKYRIDSYIVQEYPTGSATTSRYVKVVTVIVRDGNTLGTILARESSTFDPSTGT